MSILSIRAITNSESNVSRAGELKLSHVLRLATSIAAMGWQRSSTILVHETEQANLALSIEAIVDQVQALEEDKKLEVFGVKFSKAQVLEKLTTFAANEETKVVRSVTVAGWHRSLALVICAAFGFTADNVHTATVEADKANMVNVTENQANSITLAVAKIAKLQAVIALINEGAIGNEADLKKLGYNRYNQQTLWSQAKLVTVHGATVDQAVSIDKETARKLSEATSKEVKAYLKGQDTSAVPPTVKAIAKPKLEKLMAVAPCENVKALLAAICEGNEVIAERFIRTYTLTVAEPQLSE